MKIFHKKNKGFTLIELLEVIAIIGLLSSVVLVSLNSARKKSRNVTRDASIKQIIKAFDLARDSGPLPASGGRWRCISTSCYGSWSSYVANATVDAYIAPYIKKSSDPSGGRGFGGYLYIDNWSSLPAWPAGSYLTWGLEPPLISTSCGGSAYVYSSNATRIQCLFKL